MKTEFEKWWFKTTHPWTEFPHDPMEIARISFEAGWEAALVMHPKIVESIKLAGQQAARHKMQQQLMDKAVAAFSKGDDEAARTYRKMANELFGKI